MNSPDTHQLTCRLTENNRQVQAITLMNARHKLELETDTGARDLMQSGATTKRTTMIDGV